MKRVLSLICAAAFSVAIVGCHASVDTDHPNDDTSYKKTTTYDNGTKTTKTETKSETKTWEIKTTVPVPPHSTTKVTGYIQNANIDADFTATVRATKGKVLTWFLLNDGTYTETPIPLVVLLTDDERTLPVGGRFDGVEGVNAYTKVEKIPNASTMRKAS